MKGLRASTSHEDRNRYELSTNVPTGTANIAITSIQSTRPPGSINVGANAQVPRWRDQTNIFDGKDEGTDPDPITQEIADSIINGYETNQSFSIYAKDHSGKTRKIDFTKVKSET